eukprot:SAG31_NODE_2529_length_5556_cov_114.211472_2_plen_52_part_00
MPRSMLSDLLQLYTTEHRSILPCWGLLGEVAALGPTIALYEKLVRDYVRAV